MQKKQTQHKQKQDYEQLLCTGRTKACSKLCSMIVSMRNIVVVTIAVLVFFSSFLVLVTNVITTYDVTDRFVKELGNQITMGIQGKLELMLANPQNEAVQMADWVHSGLVDMYDEDDIRKLTFGGISKRPEYATYFFAFGELNSLNGFHRPTANSLWYAHSPPTGQTDLPYYSVDNFGNANISNMVSLQKNLIITQRTYYKAAVKHQDKPVAFGEPYIGSMPPSALFPCVAPIFNHTVSPPKLIGAAVVNYASYTLREFFHSLKIGAGSNVYMMTESGNLLAASDASIPGWVTNNGIVSFLNATNTTQWNPFLALSAEYILKNYDSTQNSSLFKLKIGEEGTTVQHQVMRMPGMTFHLVVIVAYNDFNGNYLQNLLISIGASFAVIILSIIIGLVVAVGSTYRLNKLAQLMSAAADMNLDAIKLSSKNLSWLSEIRQIEMSFIWLIKNLKEYKTFLPANLFSQGGVDDDSEDSKLLDPNQSAHGRLNRVTPSMGSMSDSGSAKPAFSRFELGLIQQEVSVMQIKFENFSSLAAKLSLQELVEIHSMFINKVHDVVKSKRGSIERFVGNVVTCTWNSSFPCSNYALNACTAAHDLRVAIDLLNTNVLQAGSTDLSVGIATGTASCGNMGCDAIRTFTTTGTLTKRCHLLSTLSPVYGSKILIDGNTLEKVRVHFYTLPIHTIHFAKFNKDTAWKKDVMQDRESFDLFELSRPKKKKQGDEWMYEMKDNEEERCWTEAHDAFGLKKQGLLEFAQEKLALFQKLHPEEAARVQLSSTSARMVHYFIEEAKKT